MLDSQTLIFLLQPGVIAALVAQLINWQINRDVPGVAWWTAGLAVQALAVVLRAHEIFAFSPVLSYLSFTVLMISGQCLLLFGFYAFDGRKILRLPALAVIVLLAAAVSYFTLVENSEMMRIASFTIAFAAVLAMQASILPSIARREGYAGVIVLGLAYGAALLAFASRVVMLHSSPGDIVDTLLIDHRESLFARQTLASIMAAVVAFSFAQGYILLVTSRRRWQLHQMATEDSLTGVPNRRAFETILKQAIARISRDGTRLGLVLMDIDHFKQVNDKWGHAVGDALLKHFATLARDVSRDTDFFARVGGEEFVLLLTGTTAEATRQAAERIRHAIERSNLPMPNGTLKTTVSIGTAISASGHVDPRKLYDTADAALYRAKNKGRNCVESDEIAPAAPRAPELRVIS